MSITTPEKFERSQNEFVESITKNTPNPLKLGEICGFAHLGIQRVPSSKQDHKDQNGEGHQREK